MRHHCGGHVPADMLLVELLDEQNNPVPEGQEGEVVITTLGVRGMPAAALQDGRHLHRPHGTLRLRPHDDAPLVR